MLGEKLKDFYKTIEENRNKYYGRDMGKEPVELRNAMIGYLLEHIPEGSIWFDLFTGDGVVPLALLHLQEQGLAPRVKELWVTTYQAQDTPHLTQYPLVQVDAGLAEPDVNKPDGRLVKINAEALGIKTPIVYVDVDLNGPFWHDEITPRNLVGVATLIDSAKYVKCPMLFFDELNKRLSNFKSRVHVLQAGKIPPSFLEDFKNEVLFLDRSENFVEGEQDGVSYVSQFLGEK